MRDWFMKLPLVDQLLTWKGGIATYQNFSNGPLLALLLAIFLMENVTNRRLISSGPSKGTRWMKQLSTFMCDKVIPGGQSEIIPKATPSPQEGVQRTAPLAVGLHHWRGEAQKEWRSPAATSAASRLLHPVSLKQVEQFDPKVANRVDHGGSFERRCEQRSSGQRQAQAVKPLENQVTHDKLPKVQCSIPQENRWTVLALTAITMALQQLPVQTKIFCHGAGAEFSSMLGTSL
ncbi:ectoderm-neural cortex protein 1 [Lates japonicus]|uniref:Ectoderm-neural cortex protein 1 n=1 Tax=Lates japonicus TaxID=270547 RepID=A0AAD3R1M0_LATJO|nr:ectoderm-neural cortex protein 1 [Lates japonicus]